MCIGLFNFGKFEMGMEMGGESGNSLQCTGTFSELVHGLICIHNILEKYQKGNIYSHLEIYCVLLSQSLDYLKCIPLSQASQTKGLYSAKDGNCVLYKKTAPIQCSCT